MTVKDLLVPDFTVSGKVMPLTEYPAPFHAADETVTSELVAWIVPVRFLLLPTLTLPKDSCVGVTAS